MPPWNDDRKVIISYLSSETYQHRWPPHVALCSIGIDSDCVGKNLIAAEVRSINGNPRNHRIR